MTGMKFYDNGFSRLDACEQSKELDVRLAALYGLSKKMQTVQDLEQLKPQILGTFDLFLEKLNRSLGKYEVPRKEKFLYGALSEELKLHFEQENEQEKVWSWPYEELPESLEITVSSYTDIQMHSISALKVFGYTVGVTAGWSERKRHKFLADFMEIELPQQVISLYGNHYGQPNSAERLRSVANLLAHNIISRQRRNEPSLQQAIDDWTSDLEFLHSEYYSEIMEDEFNWPDLSV